MSISLGHDPVKTVAMPTISVLVFIMFLEFVCCHKLGLLKDFKPVDHLPH